MINETNLKTFLQDRLDFNEPLSINLISNGVASDIYELDFDDKKMILKTSTVNHIKGMKKLRWQYDIQNHLYYNCPTIPVAKALVYAHDVNILSGPFFIMEYIKGEKRFDSDSVLKSYNLLTSLHEIELDNFLQKKIVNKYLQNFLNQVIIDFNFRKTESQNIDRITNWLLNNLPEKQIDSIVHNDWRIDNLSFDENGVNCVYDWELSRVGDPRLDFAIAMAYLPTNDWANGAFGYTFDFDNKLKDKLVYKYLNSKNYDAKEWKFFEILGMLSALVMAQLISLRIKRNDIEPQERFNDIDKRISIIINQCNELIGAEL
jgi:aminoglycoside phosphotransferase (APT) family kinase protein